MKRKVFWTLTIALILLFIPALGFAQNTLDVYVTHSWLDCESARFSVAIEGGTGPYTIIFDFGDDKSYTGTFDEAEFNLDHDYPFEGDYAWSLTVEDSGGQSGEASGVAVLSGPEVVLSSTPFPPLLTLEGGTASASFSATISGDFPSYSFEWDLNSDGLSDDGFDGPKAEFTYTEGGYYQTEVRVTDSCAYVGSDTLTVQVVDPESSPGDACHPTAQKIAEAVNGIFPDQAEQIYTCEDIFNIFEGALTGYQLGFGRMWHAYQLSQTIEDLTWEEILDWQLNNGGWGLLMQLDRYSDLLEEHTISELLELIASEEYSMNDVRSAIRAVTRYEADFEDALARISAGASPGELGQFYKLAQELDEDPSVLDTYLEGGHSLADLRQSVKFAERMDVEWTEIAEAYDTAGSWGELNQAYRLADDEHSAEEILAMGIQEFRSMDRDKASAQKLAEQFEMELGDVMALFNGECEGNWGCVRKALREQPQAQGASDKENRTAQQIAAKYSVSESEVMSIFNSTCAGDWACTRAHFRDLARPNKGKPGK
jgi:hypothetical protein